ncbi:GNAT superfamily N-acetyltransferase [Neorhizobium huautlense]|uniref:GNAT superfamily N-acetyltransferase n=1 Tax=Neorhizobium huautlense TaxID=67774 RepID=A0ABT9PZQ8_9HYPH|nr:GNAT family N-acetyltransferase [Neorhizobium huautlense]MDP9839966.1 GNAT superfamily N-acetyltransferase [Neorhizobium huautlense]
MDHELTISDTWAPEDEKLIHDSLVAYNVARFGQPEFTNIGIFLRDADGKIEGGLIGKTGRGWLYTQMLFIPEHLRGQGLAGKLLSKAEAEAKARGCTGAYIDSMNPDAVAAYRKYGYEIAGGVGPFSAGNGLTWLSKTL